MVLEILFEDLIIKKFIRSGTFGRIYKGRWGTQIVAIKDVIDDDRNQPFIMEARQLFRANHPNIVHIYGICINNQSNYIVMEYADCGSLHQTIHDRESTYKVSDALSWAQQCAEGLSYLHAMQPRPMIHRDIKPENLLLFENRARLKISDFGTAKDRSSKMSMKGTICWMAPEVSGTTSYNEKCDVYSWAIVLWEILARKAPFENFDNCYAIMWSVHTGYRPSTDMAIIERPLESLLVRCWQHDPQLRPAMLSVAEEITHLYADPSDPRMNELVLMPRSLN